MRILFSRKFEIMFKKCPRKIKQKTIERIEMFKENKNNPLLNNHILFGKLKGLRSINISGDWRLIFEEKPEEVILIAIGTHSKLYK